MVFEVIHARRGCSVAGRLTHAGLTTQSNGLVPAATNGCRRLTGTGSPGSARSAKALIGTPRKRSRSAGSHRQATFPNFLKIPSVVYWGTRMGITSAIMLGKEQIFKHTSRLTDYALEVAEAYRTTIISPRIEKKELGQFFTPKSVSQFMTSLFDIEDGSEIRLLDPGAGSGILSAAFCEQILNFHKNIKLTVDLYETDSRLYPYLEKTLRFCKHELEKNGHSLEFNILKKDFVLSCYSQSNNFVLLEESSSPVRYDYVISNPPYYKLNKISPEAKLTKSNNPNIYSLFMEISAGLLKNGGELVFITPRSFCSGTYYQKFRADFLEKVSITRLHVFESRKDLFDKDNVLQENIILKAKKANNPNTITITQSFDRKFNGLKTIRVNSLDVLSLSEGDVFIRIPTSNEDVEILREVDNWPDTIHGLGFEISTGPIVSFRCNASLKREPTPDSVPLLWMHNVKGGEVIWPTQKSSKEQYIKPSNKIRNFLVPKGNYVLIKRFSSKEQKRRLDAGVLVGDNLPYEQIGIENHVNYIWKINGKMNKSEAYGLTAILNSTVLDKYFRILNGHTQVNAHEIRRIPLPSIETVRTLGNLAIKQNRNASDEIINKVLKHEPIGIKEAITA